MFTFQFLKKLSRAKLTVFALILALAGCKPEEGPQGEQGEQGDPGTANVIYSDWTTFQNSIWRYCYGLCKVQWNLQ